IRSFTAVEERCKKHDHEDAFVHANVSLGFHETEFECGTQRKRPLTGFFLEVRQRFGSARGPVSWTIRSRTENINVEELTILLDHTFEDALCVGICVEPAAS